MREPLVKILDTLKRNKLACVLLVISIIGFVFAQLESNSAFPSASINTTVPREKILSIASTWANEIGFSTAGTVSSIDFDGDNGGKTFLERELTQKQANELMKSEVVPVWYWQCEFKKPLQVEDSFVQISPSGQLVNVTRRIDNDTKLPALGPAEAKNTAVKFVEEKVKRSLSGWKLIEEIQTPQVARTDYSFVWEDTTQDFKGARNRITVALAGNVISMFDISIHTPEAWDRSYETMRSYNELLYQPASVVFSLLALFCIVRFCFAVAKHELNWRFAGIIGGVFAATSIADSANSLPRWLAYYDPQQELTAFYLSRGISAISGMVISFIAAAILSAVTELCYRKFFLDKISLTAMFSKDAMRTNQMLESILMGFAIFGISQGYQIAYYLMGSSLGYWCPLGIDNYQVLSALAPCFSAFSIGLSASFMEEAMYRVVCLGVLTKVTRNFWVANVIQAMAWGFMHSTYPQQPAYARGVELTIAGIFSGWVLRRFGLPACILSHYMFDAFWGVSMLKNAPGEVSYTAFLPFIPVVGILGYCLLVRRKHGVLETDAVLQKQQVHGNSANVPPVAAESKIVRGFSYHGLSVKSRACRIAIAAVLCIAAGLIYARTEQSIGTHYKQLSIGREKAVQIARQYLGEAKVNLEGYSASASLSTESEGSSLYYLKEKVGFAATKKLVESFGRDYSWYVRFSKPLEPNTYAVCMDESGNVVSTNFDLHEKAYGAKLNDKEALAVAERFIAKYRQCYMPFQYENTSKIVRDNRIDYEFTFSVPKLKAGDAKFMLTLNVTGDQPDGMSHEWQIPDGWNQERARKSPLQEALSLLGSVLAVGIFCCCLKFIVELLHLRLMEWRVPLICAAVACMPAVVEAVNRSTLFMVGYDTTTPLTTHIFQHCLAQAGGVLGQGVAVFFLTSIFLAGMKRFYPALSLKAFAKLAFCNDARAVQATQRSLWIDAAIIIFQIGAIGVLLSFASEAAGLYFAHDSVPESVSSLDSLNYAEELSFLAGAVESVETMMIGGLTGACLCLLWKRFCGSARIAIPVFLLGLVTYSSSHYLVDGLLSAAWFVAGGLLTWWICRQSLRNPLVPVLGVWFSNAVSFLNVLKHSTGLFTAEITVVLLAFSLPLLWLLWIQLNPKKLSETFDIDSTGAGSSQKCDTADTSASGNEGLLGNAGG